MTEVQHLGHLMTTKPAPSTDEACEMWLKAQKKLQSEARVQIIYNNTV